ncbi:MAG: YaiO family outer membrane beta-barrel protein [Acidobacteria bacterium]|nr:MAG: YaiO family outer membrane beta-barrel protein [Acidobacteriota bacterium]
MIARARAASRADGIQILETHLATAPRDVDARLVYGLLLSWEGRYDDARMQLQLVLAQAPAYLDAEVALMNVEWWSHHPKAARAHVNAVLARDAGNAQARLVQQRLDAELRPWSAGMSYGRDTFSDSRAAWDESAFTVGRETPAGSLIARFSQADRFGLRDRQGEIEFYPTFRAGTSAYIEVGVGDNDRLYPSSRVSFDLYQNLGHGLEASAGFRRLNFSTSTTMYVGTLSKYARNWMFTGRIFHVPDKTLGSSQTYHAQARRYFGAEGTSFAGVTYSHGFSREEPRGTGDLVQLGADTLRGQLQLDANATLRLSVNASWSRQERAGLDALRQNTFGAGVIFRF